MRETKLEFTGIYEKPEEDRTTYWVREFEDFPVQRRGSQWECSCGKQKCRHVKLAEAKWTVGNADARLRNGLR